MENKDPNIDSLAVAENSEPIDDSRISALDQWGRIVLSLLDTMKAAQDEYDPNQTIKCIQELVTSDFRRPIYTVFSNQILKVGPIDDEDREEFIEADTERLTLNCITLLEYVFNPENKDRIENIDLVRENVVRIYNDIDLARQQSKQLTITATKAVKRASAKIDEKTKDAEKEIDKHVHQMERTYISAFTVIASILFGLIGGIAFTFNAINRITPENMYSSLAVISLVVAFIAGILIILIWLITWLVDKENVSKRSILKQPALYITLLFVVLSVWFAFKQNVQEPSYIRSLVDILSNKQ